MCEAFERAVITHCAPTLARHKCANLFVWRGCPERTLQNACGNWMRRFAEKESACAF